MTTPGFYYATQEVIILTSREEVAYGEVLSLCEDGVNVRVTEVIEPCGGFSVDDIVCLHPLRLEHLP